MAMSLRSNENGSVVSAQAIPGDEAKAAPMPSPAARMPMRAIARVFIVSVCSRVGAEGLKLSGRFQEPEKRLNFALASVSGVTQRLVNRGFPYALDVRGRTSSVARAAESSTRRSGRPSQSTSAMYPIVGHTR